MIKIFGGKLHVRRQLVLCQTYIHANPNGGWNTARCERHCSWFFTQEVHCESTHFARNSHQFSKFMPIDFLFKQRPDMFMHFQCFIPVSNRILPVYPILSRLTTQFHTVPPVFPLYSYQTSESQVALLQSTCNSSPRSGLFFGKGTRFFVFRMKKGGIIYKINLLNLLNEYE